MDKVSGRLDQLIGIIKFTLFWILIWIFEIGVVSAWNIHNESIKNLEFNVPPV